MESYLTDRFAVLSHPQRMAVFRLLMRRCPDEVPAGEIASALELKPSTASVYLSALTQADLISQRRDGTRLLYKSNLTTARTLVAGLFLDCCRGRADLCPPEIGEVLQGFAPEPDNPINVLFVCSKNSARSIIAETILRDIGGDRFSAHSAGRAHQSELNPRALDLLRSKGHDISPLRSKNIAEFQSPEAPKMDFVFTVCDRAANEDCPSWPALPVSGHWGVPDPVEATGTEAEIELAFQQTYGALRNRIAAFAALPFTQLDRRNLQHHIDNISLE